MAPSNNPNLYAVIMAGGEGTRFYPLSTPERPKQFLNFIGEKSFLKNTFERILPLIPSSKIYVSTNERYKELVQEELPELSQDNILTEPVKKNTAPALAYAARTILNRDKNAILCCLPSDHHIGDETGFRDILSRAVRLAADGYLVTLGMKPTWASVDYGYICPKSDGEWSEIENFTEKPDANTAARYISEGYLWNAGIFVWRADVFLNEIRRYAPELYPHAPVHDYFSSVPSISIDYALMEKSKKVAVVPANIGWSDVGTWESVRKMIGEGINVSSKVRAVLEGNDVSGMTDD